MVLAFEIGGVHDDNDGAPCNVGGSVIGLCDIGPNRQLFRQNKCRPGSAENDTCFIFSARSSPSLMVTFIFGALNLISTDLLHLGLRQNCKRGFFYSMYHAASSALLSDNHVSDCVSYRESSGVNYEINRNQFDRVYGTQNRLVYSDVVRVFHTLDWRIASKIEFSRVVEQFGIMHAIDVFRVIIHTFAMAEMRMEVFALLQNAMGSYWGVNHNMFELLTFVLDSQHHGDRSSVVCNILIKELASNSMLESALDAFFYAKRVGLELEILSCNFLLKRLVAAKRGELVSKLFEEMKISGPSPNAFTYTQLSGCSNQLDRNYGIHSRLLYSAVVRVFHTLDWRVASKIKFSIVVKQFGIRHAIDVFRVIVHTFSMAEMRMEDFALLRYIMGYYWKVNHNMFELLAFVLDSPDCGDRSSVVCNVLIKVFASNSMLESALDTSFYAKTVGLKLEILSCNFLLKCLVEAKRRELVDRLFEEMKISGPSPNAFTYTIVMKLYCSGIPGRIELDIVKAIDLLEEMKMLGVRPTDVTYGVFIDGLCRAGFTVYAYDLIHKLRNQNQPLNFYCYNAVINGYCQQGKTNKAERVFNDMQAHGILLDIDSYNILINTCCRNGVTDKALNFIKEMRRHNLNPTPQTYTSLITGFCRRGFMDLSHKIFVFMKDSGYEIGEASYNVLIKGFCKHGDMDSANKLFQEMIYHESLPNAYSFNNLIHGFCKVGLLDQAVEQLHRMIERGIPPSSLIYNVIVQGCCRERCLKEAIQFIYEMLCQGINPNLFSYNAIIDTICKEINPKSAWELIALMLKLNVSPNVVTYSSIIDGYVKSCNSKKARLSHVKMLNVGVANDVVLFTILINMFRRRGKVRKAYQIFKGMIRGGLDVDIISYTSMILGFCEARQMDKAMSLFHHMREGGKVTGVFTYNCLIDGFAKMNRMDYAEMLLDEMKRYNIRGNVVTYTILIARYRRLGKLDRARELFKEMRSHGILPEGRRLSGYQCCR